MFLALLQAPLQLLDLVVAVLFGFGEVGQLLLVVLLHLLPLPLLSVQLALQLVDLLPCIEVLHRQGLLLSCMSFFLLLEGLELLAQSIELAVEAISFFALLCKRGLELFHLVGS